MENMWHEKHVDYIAMSLTQLERIKTQLKQRLHCQSKLLYLLCISRIIFVKENSHKTQVMSSCHNQASNRKTTLRSTQYLNMMVQIAGELRNRVQRGHTEIKRLRRAHLFYSQLWWTHGENVELGGADALTDSSPPRGSRRDVHIQHQLVLFLRHHVYGHGWLLPCLSLRGWFARQGQKSPHSGTHKGSAAMISGQLGPAEAS